MQLKKSSFVAVKVCAASVLTVGVALQNTWAAPDVSVAKKTTANTKCNAAFLLEPSSGEVLFEQNADTPLPPASVVKLMVAYVALKQVKEGTVSLTDTVTASAASTKMGGSQVYLREGEQFSLNDMLTAMLIQSANDAAFAIAEHIGGSREGFVEMMNAEAKSLGMTNSSFTSPHGLPPSKGDEPDLMSARDTAILAKALINEFPEVLQTTSSLESDFRQGEFKMRSHNHLLRNFVGCDGLKTGYYTKAGFSIAATATRKDTRMIATVMGCEARKLRDAETARLLNTGFSQMKSVKLIDKGVPVEQSVSLKYGDVPSISPITVGDFVGVIKSGTEGEVEKKVTLCPTLEAPVAANTKCGSVTFVQNGRELGTVELVIPRSIPKVGMLGRMKQMIGME